MENDSDKNEIEEKEETVQKSPTDDYLAHGISLGICFGIAYGLITDNIVMGIAIGLSLGISLGAFKKVKNKK